MIPSAFVRLPRLPRSANGKIDHRALSYTPPERDEDRDLGQPDDFLSATVRSIWAAQLGLDGIGWHDNFFELGGHSLLALSMVDRVEHATALEVGIDVIFACPRLRDFVTAIRRLPRRSPAGGSAPPTSGERRLLVPASAAQQRFWFLHEMEPDQPAFNMPGVLRICGSLDEGALDASLREVLDRHHVLLARFSDAQGILTWTPGSGADFVLRRVDLRGVVAELGENGFNQLAKIEAHTPFDLRRQVPFRAMLARLDSTTWRLLVCIDHIVCDAWSLGVFMSDLARAYNRRVRGLPHPAPATLYDFAAYCHDEVARLERPDAFDLSAEWRGVLHGTIRTSPRLSPTTRDESDARAFSIAGDAAVALCDLSLRTGTTPFMVFASALSALMHSGSRDRETVVLGILIAQRDRVEWHEVVGPLLNVSVLAVDLALGDTLSDALRRTRDSALRAYRSCHVPYQELIGWLKPAAGGDESPFEVLLVMQPEPGEPIAFDGLATELVEIDTGTPPYPLIVDIEPRDGGYHVTHRFAPHRYNARDVAALATRFEAFIRSMVGDSGATLEEILRRAERCEGS